MKKINDVLQIYNIQKNGNYYIMKDENFVGCKIYLVFPFGMINGYDLLLPVYMNLAINNLNANTKFAKYDLIINDNNTIIDITVFSEYNKITTLAETFNFLNTFINIIPNYNTDLYKQILDGYKEEYEVLDYSFKIGYLESINKMYNNLTKVKECFDNAAARINEMTANVFIQCANDFDYLTRHNNDLILEKVNYNIDKIKEQYFVLEFDKILDCYLIEGIIKTLNTYNFYTQKYNDKYYIIFIDDINYVKSSFKDLDSVIDSIFSEQYKNDIYASLVSSLYNKLLNLKKDIKYVVDNILNNNEVFENYDEIGNVYKLSMDEIVTKMKEYVLNRI